MASVVTFKLILNNNNSNGNGNKTDAHIRRLTLRDEDISLAAVRSRARQLFQLRDDTVWFFKWQDEEGDFVTITEDDEFDDVVHAAVPGSESDWARSSALVRLFICVEQQQQQHQHQAAVLRFVMPVVEQIAAAAVHVPHVRHQGPRQCRREHKKQEQTQQQQHCQQQQSGDFAATCDLSNVRLTMEQGNWYHKPGSTLDVSVEEASKLSEDEQRMFVRVTQPSDLGTERELYERKTTTTTTTGEPMPQQQQKQPRHPDPHRHAHGHWHHPHHHFHHQHHAHGPFAYPPHHAWAAAAAEAASKAHAETSKQGCGRSRVWPYFAGSHSQHSGREQQDRASAAHPFAGLQGLFEGTGLVQLQHVGWCDVTGQMLVAGQGWFHKRNSNYDMCESEFNKLSAEDKTLYVRVDKPTDLGTDEQRYNTLHRAGEMAQHVMQELFGEAAAVAEEMACTGNSNGDDKPTSSFSSSTDHINKSEAIGTEDTQTCSSAPQTQEKTVQVEEQPVAPVSEAPTAAASSSSLLSCAAPSAKQGVQEDDWELVAMLRDMGFEDETECRHALRENQRDINAAALALLRARARWHN